MKEKILIVDDDHAVLKLLSRILFTAGYECDTAANGAEAKEKLDSSSFDLLLSDLQMPGESGLELLSYTKKYYPHIGRIVITGFGSPEIADEILAVGVYGYIIKPVMTNVVLITVKNALLHLYLDMNMQACKKELENNLASSTQNINVIVDNINAGIVMLDPAMQILKINKKMLHWFPAAAARKNPTCYSVFTSPQTEALCKECPVKKTFLAGTTSETVRHISTVDGEKEFRIVTSPVVDSSGRIYAVIAVYEDVTEKLRLERDLAQAQKFEAVGQLAAGIAHEINSPLQYIGDNISFLEDSFTDMIQAMNGCQKLLVETPSRETDLADLRRKLSSEIEAADIPFLLDEIPKTFSQTIEGVRRVEKIVRAMKEFSHPDSEEKTAVDINKIIESTITVCKNEWKYVADIETELAEDLPLVPCFAGEISQVLLNIIVNGAHAIADLTENGSKGKGRITITTKKIDQDIQIRIDDTGGGIPENIKEQVFDPFFTTKALGKGTGQGLAIARRIVEKHQGKIGFLSKKGNGTIFMIEIPMGGNSHQ